MMAKTMKKTNSYKELLQRVKATCNFSVNKHIAQSDTMMCLQLE